MAATLQESFDNGTSVYNAWVSSTVYYGQTWTTASSYELYEFSLKLIKPSASFPGNTTAYLFAVNGSGQPILPILATSNVFDANSLPTGGSGTWVDFVFATQPLLANATKYAVCIQNSWGSAGKLRVITYKASDAYVPGQLAWGSGLPMPVHATYDCVFRAQGEDPLGDVTVDGVTIAAEGGFDITGATFLSSIEPILGAAGNFVVTPTFENTIPQATILAGITFLPQEDISTKVQGAASGHDPRFNDLIPTWMGSYLTSDDTSSTPSEPTVEEADCLEMNDQHFWFERTTLLPRGTVDLGQIVSQQTIPIELYNADRYEAITVISVIDNLGAGLSIAGVPATPYDIDPQTSTSAVVTVETAGALSVDASYTFVTTVGTYTFYITGSRIVLFPIRPMSPMREHLLFSTTVLEATDGSEQRIANRKTPRSMFEFTIKSDRRRMEMLLFDRQNKVLATPAWHEPSFVASPVSIGDSTVTVDSTDYASFHVGGYAIVFQDEGVYDALEIQSMTSTTLTFTSTTAFAYANNTQVMPLMLAYVQSAVAAQKNLLNTQTFNLRLTVPAIDEDIADASAFGTRGGLTFLDEPNMVESGALSEVLEQKRLVIDNTTGLYGFFSQWQQNKRRSVKGFKTNTRQELWELRQLFHYLKGQQVAFYIPTFSKDIVPNQKLLNAGTGITMDFIGYTVNADGRAPKDEIRVWLKDGTLLERTITGYAELSQAEEQLSVDSPWPYDIEVDDIERIEFIEKVRLNVDDITITHYNALGLTKTFVPTKEVFD